MLVIFNKMFLDRKNPFGRISEFLKMLNKISYTILCFLLC